MQLEELEGLLHEVANVLALALGVVDPIVDVQFMFLNKLKIGRIWR